MKCKRLSLYSAIIPHSCHLNFMQVFRIDLFSRKVLNSIKQHLWQSYQQKQCQTHGIMLLLLAMLALKNEIQRNADDNKKSTKKRIDNRGFAAHKQGNVIIQGNDDKGCRKHRKD